MKALIVNHFPVMPPDNGGKLRIANLADSISRHFNVTLIAPLSVKNVVHSRSTIKSTRWGENGTEIACAESPLKPMLLGPLYMLGYNSVDSFSSNRLFDMSSFARHLKREIADSNIILMEHPFMSRLVSRLTRRASKKLVYDAIDVEYVSALFQNKGNLIGDLVLGQVRSVEELACRMSNHVFATTDHDRKLIEVIYGLPKEKISTIPIGVETERIMPPTADEKADAREALGIAPDTVLITYLGSAAPHNIKVLDKLMKLAAETGRRSVRFYIGGSVTRHVTGRIHSNVTLAPSYKFGDPNIYAALQATDVAVSIDAAHKTGTPVKTLEYMAHGLPVLVTHDEAARIGLVEGINARVSSLDDMGKKLDEMIENPEDRKKLGSAARKFVVENHDSKKSGEKAVALLKEILI